MNEMTNLTNAELPHFCTPARDVHGPAPLRRPGSVRRTTTLDAVWPQGRGGLMQIYGAGRDLLTPPDGGAKQLSKADVHVSADRRRTIHTVYCPERPILSELAGAKAGGKLRATIDEVLPGERERGSLLYLLLDDLAGATLVAGWAFGQWPESQLEQQHVSEFRSKRSAKPMLGVCIGFRPGSSALNEEGFVSAPSNCTPVPGLVNPEDPVGWHELHEREGVHFRRARRIDVWRNEAGEICIDAGFQDSGSCPDGRRMGIHEYRLHARADANGILRFIDAVPGTLPFPECRAAPANAPALLGTPLDALREEVIVRLRSTAGCTHLNDMLRALAEVPMLMTALA